MREVSTRVRRTVAVAAVLLASVTWGASASAAPHAKPASPAHHPVLISHLMSSCGHMDRL